MFFKNKKDNLTEAEREAIEFNKKQEEYDNKLKEEARKITFKNKLSILRFPTFTKNLVAFIIGFCIIDLQLTYVLAFIGKEQLAESLSMKLCDTILGVAFAYIIRAFFDTFAEKGGLDNLGKKKSDGLLNSLTRYVNAKFVSTVSNAADGADMSERNCSDDELSIEEDDC